MSTTNQHLPVLVDEVISYLNPQNKKSILMVLLGMVVTLKNIKV